jgi:hypothetical protein
MERPLVGAKRTYAEVDDNKSVRDAITCLRPLAYSQEPEATKESLFRQAFAAKLP